jgi:hypothetical protein
MISADDKQSDSKVVDLVPKHNAMKPSVCVVNLLALHISALDGCGSLTTDETAQHPMWRDEMGLRASMDVEANRKIPVTVNN